VLELAGPTSIDVDVGADYADAGITAVDTYEGDVTNTIVVSVAVKKPPVQNILDCSTGIGAITVPETVFKLSQPNGSSVTKANVNTFAAPGTEYNVTFSVVDKAGNRNAVARHVRLVDRVAPVVHVLGAALVLLDYRRNSSENQFVDAGFTVVDVWDGDLHALTCVTVLRKFPTSVSTVIDFDLPLSSISSSMPLGTTYRISFRAMDFAGNMAVVTRNVTVVDVSPPVLALNGSVAVRHVYGVPYVDAGATVQDNHDESSAMEIHVLGDVPTRTPGLYTLEYRARDASGNDARPLMRNVTVDVLRPPTKPFRFRVELADSVSVVNDQAALLEAAFSNLTGGFAFIIGITTAGSSVSNRRQQRRLAGASGGTTVEFCVRMFAPPHVWILGSVMETTVTVVTVQAQMGSAVTVTSAAASQQPTAFPVGVIAGVVGGFIVFVIAVVAVLVLRRRRRSTGGLDKAHEFTAQFVDHGKTLNRHSRETSVRKVLEPNWVTYTADGIPYLIPSANSYEAHHANVWQVDGFEIPQEQDETGLSLYSALHSDTAGRTQSNADNNMLYNLLYRETSVDQPEIHYAVLDHQPPQRAANEGVNRPYVPDNNYSEMIVDGDALKYDTLERGKILNHPLLNYNMLDRSAANVASTEYSIPFKDGDSSVAYSTVHSELAANARGVGLSNGYVEDHMLASGAMYAVLDTQRRSSGDDESINYNVLNRSKRANGVPNPTFSRGIVEPSSYELRPPTAHPSNFYQLDEDAEQEPQRHQSFLFLHTRNDSNSSGIDERNAVGASKRRPLSSHSGLASSGKREAPLGEFLNPLYHTDLSV
jgi:hypothetical protein